MKTLSFSKDRVRILVSSELGSVVGGIAQPTATAVSSKAPVTVSSVRPEHAPLTTFITPKQGHAPLTTFITPKAGLWG